MSDTFDALDPSTQTTALSPLADVDFPDEQERGLSPKERSAVDALPADSALLIVRKGPNLGARFLLDAEKTVAGRHPSCDIFLDDVTVSRRHVAFLRHGGQFVVRDMGSLNGTYVERERVDEATLVNGQEVQIGKYRMTFHQIVS
ncbi:FHA domain-containing protein [Helcobacillus massiliensis]|uniref:PSer/pThr/pTyr-binding forkhead associated (FHA) protein n=1 Tax=Helcobacillus massiliensis TaxID=521392 RepID=A0A839QWM7_9MICO|nr:MULTISPECIES: FHA domain-containing protein [Helcobacillus]MBB3022391.1 pSer/pThr/pTyr-binding forkhead associated (FHA) protein [Helcobacillus massiliensis]MCG7426965.1 FHA domain-containing protein [Helcobacillus sp. ACRRO]MCT1557029.1 FHA domain-containing protein [Helcobacillus massiliensis]MCT2035418.1 FHA domain-containing protein [Helcobacillus massiliensis]MCT2331367.1 FHA domain-containing protein [Helcobacillus massiliensis]